MNYIELIQSKPPYVILSEVKNPVAEAAGAIHSRSFASLMMTVKLSLFFGLLTLLS